MTARDPGRFNLNFGEATGSEMRKIFSEAGLTIAQGLLQAFKVWKWVHEAQQDGTRLIAVRKEGEKVTQRELMIL